MKITRLLIFILLNFTWFNALSAQELIVDLSVRGNKKVESDAIKTLLKTEKGSNLDLDKIQDDIRTTLRIKLLLRYPNF